ncbi:NtaA/DmoA family FMN-dependent monooxygenase [Streptosporangium saharense]|uniref:NtaA/DmoA family FMN-dependent monooxygenase n=1 Tax=Streptosporangium saharense TaxID=1706840 RepID=UPI00343AA349
MSEKRQVKLGHSIWPEGRHGTGWRRRRHYKVLEGDPNFYRATAQTAERGLFDYFFLGNGEASRLPGKPGPGNREWSADKAANGVVNIADGEHYWTPNGLFKLDSFTANAYVAALTSNIGLVSTFNTTYQHPFNVARQTATLDHLSRGRAAINIVTGRSDDAARNYGFEEQPDGDARWDRAEEFVQILWSLWDGWQDGWYVGDREGGRFLDLDKIHPTAFRGKHFSVEGPLNIPPSPQRRPPLIVAGTSQRSFEFGAKYADVRFIPFADKQAEYYRKQKELAAQYHRDPDDYHLLPGITFYVDETSTAAHARFREIQDLSVVPFDAGALGRVLGVDLGNAGPYDKVKDVVDVAAHPGSAWLVKDAFLGFGDEDITLADLDHFVVNGPANQVPVVGSGQEVADWIEENFEDRKLDGVVVFPPYQPGSLDAFVDLVVPELQRRGLFRTAYTGTTFREHLGPSAAAKTA